MKGFLVLLVLAAGGLAGVYYWREYVQAPRAVVAAREPAPGKEGKDRHRRKRRGARRLARNEVFVATASPDESTTVDDRPPTLAPSPPPEERPPAPLAPGGAATTESAPSDVFGPMSSPSQTPSGGRRPQPPEPEPVKLRAADLKMVWQGEDLSKTETMRLDFSKDEGGHELSQDEIDARFRSKEDAVLGCVDRARPDPFTFVPGRVTVKFRIQKTGVVKGVQVEAPVILHKGGLTGCIKGIMVSLRFPASNASQVISYPFTLM